MFETLGPNGKPRDPTMPTGGYVGSAAGVGNKNSPGPSAVELLLPELRLCSEVIGYLRDDVRELVKESRHLREAVDPSQQEQRRHECIAPVARTVVTCLRETREVVRRARRQRENELNQVRAEAYDLVARHFSACATRLQSALLLFGVVESRVLPGEALDFSRHVIMNEQPAPSDSALGTVARVIAHAWVDQRSGQVYCPAMVDVYVSVRGR